MKYFVNNIELKNSDNYFLVELQLCPKIIGMNGLPDVSAEHAVYASCVIDKQLCDWDEFGEPIISLKKYSKIDLLRAIDSGEGIRKVMEDESDDYSDEYDQLLMLLEKYTNLFYMDTNDTEGICDANAQQEVERMVKNILAVTVDMLGKPINGFAEIEV